MSWVFRAEKQLSRRLRGTVVVPNMLAGYNRPSAPKILSWSIVPDGCLVQLICDPRFTSGPSTTEVSSAGRKSHTIMVLGTRVVKMIVPRGVSASAALALAM